MDYKFLYNEQAYTNFDDCMEAVASDHIHVGSDELPDIFDKVVEDIDIANCDHPENAREYDSRLATLATLEQPAEFYEWFTCGVCGETVEE